MRQELALLYQALRSPLGIVVSVSDFGTCSQRLYKAKREACDPELAPLQFRRSPYNPEGELWIVRGGAIPSKELPDVETD